VYKIACITVDKHTELMGEWMKMVVKRYIEQISATVEAEKAKDEGKIQ